MIIIMILILIGASIFYFYTTFAVLFGMEKQLPLIKKFALKRDLKRKKKEEEYKSIAVEEELTIEETQILKENDKWDKIATIN